MEEEEMKGVELESEETEIEDESGNTKRKSSEDTPVKKRKKRTKSKKPMVTIGKNAIQILNEQLGPAIVYTFTSNGMC